MSDELRPERIIIRNDLPGEPYCWRRADGTETLHYTFAEIETELRRLNPNMFRRTN